MPVEVIIFFDLFALMIMYHELSYYPYIMFFKNQERGDLDISPRDGIPFQVVAFHRNTKVKGVI